jgi:transcriptional regulator GlxA family with amidase domain
MEGHVNFGVLVFNDVEELDFVGPWEVLGMWGKYAGGPERRLIVAESSAPVVCAKGLSINPHVTFEQCPPLDFLLVPGGNGVVAQAQNPACLGFIGGQARRCHSVLSVCTGSLLLHHAGLLTGKRATTHWDALGRLRSLGGVTVVEERLVKDGNIWTAAGVSAGIDLMLAFIAEHAGIEVAGKVQFAAEYYPSTVRYGQFASHPKAPAYLKSGT